MHREFEITSARVFAIAGPAMVANLTTPLLGMVATAAIGQLGEPQLLGGVAMASVVFDCLFWLFGFLRMGTVAFTAQALGAHDEVEIRAVLLRALLAAVISGTVLLALQLPLAVAMFGVMGGSTAVTAAGKLYFAIRLWSAPFTLANYVLQGWLIGQARTMTALAIQIVINVINIIMTLWLVLGLGIGISGAAIAAVVAEFTGCIIGLAIAWRLLEGRLGIPRATLFDRGKLLHLLAVNRDIMIRAAALIAAFFFFTAQGARAGDVTLAANAVLNNFIMIGSFFLDGLASAAEQLCGRSFGARNKQAFTRSVKLILLWSMTLGVAVTLLFLAFGEQLIDVMSTSVEVRSTARQFLILAAFAPVCGVMAYSFDGIYIGATWARDMRNLMIAAFAAYLGAWYLLQPLGNSGLWLALLVFFMARGAFQAARYPALARMSFD